MWSLCLDHLVDHDPTETSAEHPTGRCLSSYRVLV